jgi:hypothetical protein
MVSLHAGYLMSTKSELKSVIIRSLRRQGFRICGGRLLPPTRLDKTVVRQMHCAAVVHRVARSEDGLRRYEDVLLVRIANGSDIVPADICPRLVQVEAGSQDELLFRYVSLHWSIPVSSGYGRRLRFLVVDDSNDKLIGILGLGDPVFSLAPRDDWIGWTNEMRRQRLHHVMDAYVLGAVPPYSRLLGGKLVAMLAASEEVRSAFKIKYAGRRSLISGKPLDARLALITTTSALGRSSIYNRVTFAGRTVFRGVGFTRGSGDFHFFNGTYEGVRSYAEKSCEATAKNELWGSGFRNRREVVKKCLRDLGLSAEWLYHGVKREVFVVPLAHNTCAFLRGEHSRVRWFSQSAGDLIAWFKERWLLPRAQRMPDYNTFDREEYRIWRNPG